MRLLEPYIKDIPPKKVYIYSMVSVSDLVFNQSLNALNITSIVDSRTVKNLRDSCKQSIDYLGISYKPSSIQTLERSLSTLKDQENIAILIDTVKNYPQNMFSELRNIKILMGDILIQEIIEDKQKYRLRTVLINSELKLVKTEEKSQ